MTNLYDIPTVSLFALFIILAILISIFGLYLINYLTNTKESFKEGTVITVAYVGIIGTIVGLILSFIIINVWNT